MAARAFRGVDPKAARARLRRHGLSVGENDLPGARILAPDPTASRSS
jgi:hypothetical protein